MTDQKNATHRTPRLELRRLDVGDGHSVFGLLSDERVVRYMLFPLFTREKAASFVERFAAQVVTGDPPQCVFAIDDRKSHTLIGLCGFVLDSAMEQGEIWYLLDPDWWGKGITTEAVSGLIDHGFSALGLHRIWASCLPINPASSRVLEKLGLRREGLHLQNLKIHGHWHDSYLYAILSDEWKSAP